MDGDHINNVEQVTLDETILKSIDIGENDYPTVIVTVSNTKLLTTHQPFSIVITGKFDWDEVDVDDSNWWDYEDKPQTQRYGATERNYWVPITVVVVLCCVCLLYILWKKFMVRRSEQGSSLLIH